MYGGVVDGLSGVNRETFSLAVVVGASDILQYVDSAMKQAGSNISFAFYGMPI